MAINAALRISESIKGRFNKFCQAGQCGSWKVNKGCSGCLINLGHLLLSVEKEMWLKQDCGCCYWLESKVKNIKLQIHTLIYIYYMLLRELLYIPKEPPTWTKRDSACLRFKTKTKLPLFALFLIVFPDYQPI